MEKIGRYAFAWEPSYRRAALVFGITPARAWVALGDDDFEARFGWWHLKTPRRNVVGAEVTGPYAYIKTAGPPHLGITDRSLSFATNGDRGVCVEFAAPVGAIEPTGRLTHPSLTVTVRDYQQLADALNG